jgi:pimeloyl-ACP methyl ester carboxylesterase
MTGTAVRIRRGFVDVGEGQAHYRTAGAGGTPLVLLHQASGSARMMEPLMRHLAQTRRTIAIDLAGNGDSSPAPMAEPTMTDYAGAVLAALDGLGVERFDVYGFHAGASAALEAAIAWPDRVRRLVLDSLSLYDPAERAAMEARYLPRIARHPHGLHLSAVWHYVRDTYLFWPWFAQDAAHRRAVDVPSTPALHDKVVEVLKGFDGFEALYLAAFRHDKAARLPLVRVPTLAVCGPTNSQFAALERVATLVPGCDRLAVPGTYDDANTAETARLLAGWLDEPRA